MFVFPLLDYSMLRSIPSSPVDILQFNSDAPVIFRLLGLI